MTGIAALVLAAGRSERMGGANKLIATINGRPLVRIAAEAALASRARPVVVVTGHEPRAIEAALAGLGVRLVHNQNHAAGLSTSLRAGIAALPADVDGAVVLLADMPAVDMTAIDRLIDAFDQASGARIIVPTHDGKRGNPVIWPARFFADLLAAEGDIGGRYLIGAHADAVVEVDLGPAVALDIDTPEALAAAGGRPA